MYKAVNENIAQIKDTPGATVTTLPSWALIGAELQDPKTGADPRRCIPGRGQNMSTAKKCTLYDCDQNTITHPRAGRVLVQAVRAVDGRVAGHGRPEQHPELERLTSASLTCPRAWHTPRRFRPRCTTSRARTPAARTRTTIKVENDGGEAIGTPVGPKGDNLWKTTVQNALAQSSNTAFTDLAHRATHAGSRQDGGELRRRHRALSERLDLTNDIGQVPTVALGVSSLTVNEQTQMLATIDDNGVYHAGHVVKSWQLPDQAVQTPIVATHVVLTPAQDSAGPVRDGGHHRPRDGDQRGSAGLGGRQIIAKTGTTSNYLSGFFIGAIPQYAMVVGMFVNQQDSSNLSADNLSDLGGGGFGGFWPANIWNTFAQAEFANLTPQSFQSPQFSGQLWNLIGPLPKAKPKKKPSAP